MRGKRRICALDGCDADLDVLGLRLEAIYCRRSHKMMARKRRQRAVQKLARREAATQPAVVEAPSELADISGPVCDSWDRVFAAWRADDLARLEAQRQARREARAAEIEEQRADARLRQSERDLGGATTYDYPLGFAV